LLLNTLTCRKVTAKKKNFFKKIKNLPQNAGKLEK